MTLAESLVEWAWKLDLRSVPAAAREAARRHLTDGVGCALGARRLGSAPFATVFAGSEGPSTVLGDGRTTSPAAAAFANGTLVHALDFDDTHAGALIHATAAVLPAAFAVGEEVDASGAQVLEAAIAGYEVVLRLGAALRHGFHARGFHATSVCGVFAAALVTARLRGLDSSTAVEALGIAGSQAAGSLEFLHTGSSTKQLHPGWAGLAGIAAADLAAAGATGPASILEGEHGLYRSYADREVEPARVLAGLGERWEVTRITIKPYPLCQLSHASLDALATVLDQIPASEAVEQIDVVIPEESVPVIAEPRAAKLEPRTPYEAKFSLPWDLGLLIADGAVTEASFDSRGLDRPEVRKLADKVEVHGSATSIAPAEAPGEVAVALSDGRRLVGRVPSSRGGPDAPLSDDELVAKFVGSCGPSHPDPEGLARRLLALDREPVLGPLLAATRLQAEDQR